MKLSKFFILGLFFLASVFYGCSISLSGVQVPPGLTTFSVEYIVNNADIQVPTLSQEITDQLTDKVARETPLKFNNEKPDIEFNGQITRYSATSQAPTAGQNTSLNRLDIDVRIEFTNHSDEEANWSQTFNGFANFDPTENLATVQDDLIASILKDIIEDIYQKAFTNW